MENDSKYIIIINKKESMFAHKVTVQKCTSKRQCVIETCYAKQQPWFCAILLSTTIAQSNRTKDMTKKKESQMIFDTTMNWQLACNVLTTYPISRHCVYKRGHEYVLNERTTMTCVSYFICTICVHEQNLVLHADQRSTRRTLFIVLSRPTANYYRLSM